jgi:hypothetical protein
MMPADKYNQLAHIDIGIHDAGRQITNIDMR